MKEVLQCSTFKNLGSAKIYQQVLKDTQYSTEPILTNPIERDRMDFNELMEYRNQLRLKIEKRAREKFETLEYPVPECYEIVDIDFLPNEIFFVYWSERGIEISPCYHCGGYITYNEMRMSECDWQFHLTKLQEQKAESERRIKEAKEKQLYENKVKQYLKLKEELGIDNE